MRTTAALTLALGISIAALACGSPSGPSQSGNLRVTITDAPFTEATALHVTFSEVKVHRADGEGGWITVPFAGTPAATTRTCNLKKLEGPSDILGVASLDAGHYTQLRLVVDAAAIYFGGAATAEGACATALAAPTGASSEAVQIPSGEVKLIHPFELMSAGATTVELDFDGNKSVHQTGNGRYMMSPVIRVSKVNTAGGS